MQSSTQPEAAGWCAMVHADGCVDADCCQLTMLSLKYSLLSLPQC
jgi:hypothetical protein